MDIPECDLVVRFSKPNNFSSYMQSKGRARAKKNAAYVLFMDESDVNAATRDRMEYENYELIEKVCFFSRNSRTAQIRTGVSEEFSRFGRCRITNVL